MYPFSPASHLPGVYESTLSQSHEKDTRDKDGRRGVEVSGAVSGTVTLKTSNVVRPIY
jgi:hypothetical protein